jgi:hypothetical protein
MLTFIKIDTSQPRRFAEAGETRAKADAQTHKAWPGYVLPKTLSRTRPSPK